MESILERIRSFAGEREGAPPLPASSEIIEREAKIALVIFSKSRPYQLHQTLRSVALFLEPPPSEIAIIYLPEDYELQYKTVFAFHRCANRLPINAVRQTDFHADVRNTLTELARSGGTHVLFAVDDLVFYQMVDLSQCARSLSDCPRAYAAHLKLHPGIVFSHAANKLSPPPLRKPLIRPPFSSPLSDLSLSLFELALGKVDWRYPFDLCGALYRMEDLLFLFQSLARHHLESTNKNPNFFEMLGNQLFWRDRGREFTCCLSVSRPVLSVVTVNQVQSTFKVPIYRDIKSGKTIDMRDEEIDVSDLSVLNDRLLSLSVDRDDSTNLDLDRYHNNIYLSVHIGDVFLAPAIPRSPSLSRVTLILPIFNGEAHITSCLENILSISSSLSFSLIIVNDGSTDRTAEKVNGFIDRLQQACHAVQVLSFLSNRGLAVALDEAVRCAETEFAARIDVDDLITPMRLRRQVEFLSHNPLTHVVGTQAQLEHIDENAKEEQRRNQVFESHMPTHPLLVELQLFFQCPLLHPTVCYRTSIVRQCGGYCAVEGESGPDHDDYVRFIEDYYLWWRIAQRYPCSLANLADVCGVVRIHSQSKSRMEAFNGEEARVKLLAQQWRRFLSTVAAESLTSPEQWQRAVRIITSPTQILDFSVKEELGSVLSLIDVLGNTFCDRILPNYCTERGESEEVKDMLSRLIRNKCDLYRKQVNAATKPHGLDPTKNPSLVVEDLLFNLASF